MSGKIVDHPLKVDLHIHSAASRHKDGALVKNGTVENVGILVSALERYGVNAAAITDHDCFSFDMYSTFLAAAGKSPVLEKVFPGVEFTVMFDGATGKRPIHLVTLFEDSDIDAVRRIAGCIPWKGGGPDYDEQNAFSEDKYWSIIRDIGLDIVVIAHQKESLTSSSVRKNDANSLGQDKFNEFLFLDYFEAYEYRNKKNELFNKKYVYEKDQRDALRFITGSDCHEWSAYPEHKAGESHPFKHTHLKCLPTFRGLAMAVTDVGRIRTTDGFFAVSHPLESIDLVVEGKSVSVPLLPGINAIIGDNSIGKSCLVNALMDFREVSATDKRGYEKYLRDKDVEVVTRIDEGDIAKYDGQDAIRDFFANLSEKSENDLLAKHFPENTEVEVARKRVKTEIARYAGAVEKACEYAGAVDELPVLAFPQAENLENPINLAVLNNLDVHPKERQGELVAAIAKISQDISAVVEDYAKELTKEDREDLDRALEALKRVETRHRKVLSQITLENCIINCVSSNAKAMGGRIRKVATDAQNLRSEFSSRKADVCSAVVGAIKSGASVRGYGFSFEPVRIKPVLNPVGPYHFVAKASIDELGPKYLRELAGNIIGKRKNVDPSDCSYSRLKDAIKKYPEDDSRKPTEVLKERMESQLDKELCQVRTINGAGDDPDKELSRGLNARMYFALLADERLGSGMYIVDQPEDQISQRAIKKSVLSDFRDIAQARQVLLITHNPQFIVNLDVDNVIFLGKSGESLRVRSGALEYENEEENYTILDIVAENIEGGMETIRRRMKRYEKAN